MCPWLFRDLSLQPRQGRVEGGEKGRGSIRRRCGGENRPANGRLGRNQASRRGCEPAPEGKNRQYQHRNLASIRSKAVRLRTCIPYLGFMASDRLACQRATVGRGLQSAGNARKWHRPSSATGCDRWTKLPSQEVTSIQINHLQLDASEQDYRGQPSPCKQTGASPGSQRGGRRGIGRAAA